MVFVVDSVHIIPTLITNQTEPKLCSFAFPFNNLSNPSLTLSTY